MKKPPKRNRRTQEAKPEGSHAVGLQQNPYVQRQALKVLPTAKEMEEKKRAAGWIYIRKEKTSKQVHPDKIEAYLEEGWKVAN